MTSAPIRESIVANKTSYIRVMVAAIRALPLSTYEHFTSDTRNGAAAESYLRRALESLFDLGRHIVAKAFAAAPVEYREIAERLVKEGVVSPDDGRILRIMAGYRNRMVHFYDEIGTEELYRICRDDIQDIERIQAAFSEWLRLHPEKIDTRL